MRRAGRAAVTLAALATCIAAPARSRAGWEIDTVDDAVISVSMALDSSDQAHLCYFVPGTFGTRSRMLTYATNADTIIPGTWRTETVEHLSGSTWDCAIEVDSYGGVHIAYLAHERMWYATQDAEGWSIQSVSEHPADESCDLVLDSDGRPHVSFRRYEEELIGDTLYRRGTPYYATLLAEGWRDDPVDVYIGSPQFTPGGAAWNAIDIDDYGKVYVAAKSFSFQQVHTNSQPFSNDWYGSQQLSSGHATAVRVAPTGRVHVSYITTGPKRGDLMWAVRTPTGNPLTGQEWGKYVLEHVGVGYVGVEREDVHTSLVLDDEGQPHIAYFDAVEQDLKYTARTLSGPAEAGDNEELIVRAWVTEAVDRTGDVGRSAALALDSTGQPHIAYLDAGAGTVKYARRTAAQGPLLRSSPSRWNFGAVREGRHTGEPKTIWLTNVGTEALEVSHIYLRGTYGAYYTLEYSGPWLHRPLGAPPRRTIEPGDFRAVRVRFTPPAEGRTVEYTGRVVVESSGGTVDISLVGLGVTYYPNARCGLGLELALLLPPLMWLSQRRRRRA
jgi:hypothetical protein